MSNDFPELLKNLRLQKKLSQQTLANMMYVDRSTVASWETGRRIPDTATLARLAVCLGTDVSTLFGSSAKDDHQINVMVVDDEKIILTGSLTTLEKAMPQAAVWGFRKPSEAIDFACSNRVDLAFVDIEMGSVSGLDLCRKLLAINPNMNVIFLTAHIDYSFSAWNTGACGFLLKPLTARKIREQLSQLRFPIK